ncbi:MAG TPA: ferrichrome ABC transporter permease, partial [Myxococcota bacterium]|nr:ferrichrome ABC transporter permease [Myxococcota bacterium]
MPPFAIAIFLGALLLFLVQPMLGKFILPWFGGTPATWTACLLFFQLVLLVAYAYAHTLQRVRSLGRQVGVHLALAALAGAQLAWQALAWPAPTLPGAGLAPAAGGAPALHVLWLLTASVGLPYLALGATSPLLQAWFHRAAPARSPYRLYALSNLGSLAALVAYPFLLEPVLGLRAQGWAWAAGFGLYALAVVGCALAALRAARAPAAADAPAPAAPAPAPAAEPAPGPGRVLLWIGLAASASLVLAAATNQMTMEVASGPFLWVLPLGLYLLTFVLAFAEPSRYPRRALLPVLPVVLGLCAAALWKGPSISIGLQVATWSACVFVCALCCHGELHRLRPAPRHLTGFYLSLSLGGALGGAFASLAAPLLFSGLFELHLGLLATAACVWLALLADRGSVFHGRSGVFARVGAALLTLALAGVLLAHAWRWSGEAQEASRDFYGLLRVQEYDADQPALHRKDLFHGLIRHGTQLQSPDRRREPTTYYGPRSGAGLALQFHA